KRGAELAQSIVDAISVVLETIDEAPRDAVLNEALVLVPELRVDWKTIAAQAAGTLAVGLEVTLVDDRGRERARMVAAGVGGRGLVWRVASHTTMLCGEEVNDWRARIRSAAPLVSLYDRAIWDDLQSGRVALWQTDEIEVPITRLIQP